MVELRTRRLHNKRGQSILEYLVITTVVVLAILAVSTVVRSQSDAMFQQAGTKVGESTAAIGTMTVVAH